MICQLHLNNMEMSHICQVYYQTKTRSKRGKESLSEDPPAWSCWWSPSRTGSRPGSLYQGRSSVWSVPADVWSGGHSQRWPRRQWHCWRDSKQLHPLRLSHCLLSTPEQSKEIRSRAHLIPSTVNCVPALPAASLITVTDYSLTLMDVWVGV